MHYAVWISVPSSSSSSSSINQSINQSFNQSINPSITQSIAREQVWAALERDPRSVDPRLIAMTQPPPPPAGPSRPCVVLEGNHRLVPWYQVPHPRYHAPVKCPSGCGGAETRTLGGRDAICSHYGEGVPNTLSF